MPNRARREAYSCEPPSRCLPASFGAVTPTLAPGPAAAPWAQGGKRTDDDSALRADLLRHLGILDSAPEPGFDGLTRTAATLTGCPIALVSLLDSPRQWFKSAFGLAVSETPLAASFCAHAIVQSVLFQVEDTWLDPRFVDNPLVTGPPGIRFYAGQPLEVDGVRVGTLCVVDTRPGRLTPEVGLALAGLAATASALLRASRTQADLLDHQRRLADIALASGSWLWESDSAYRVGWRASSRAHAGDADLLMPASVLPDGPLLNGRGEPLAPRATLHRTLAEAAPVSGAIIAVEAPAGTTYLSFSALPSSGGRGPPGGFRGTACDVSAAIAAERERYDADLAVRLERDSAHQSARLRSELVSTVSHELRTPLNAMLGFSQLLLRDPSDTAFCATQIHRAGSHLLGLVNDMLDLARLESGRDAVDLRPVHTASVIRRCVDFLDPEAQRRGVNVTWAVDGGAEAVLADLRGLTQALLNLLSNGLKASPRGSTVSVRARRGPADRVDIGVTDEGAGIAAALLPALFEPFSQLAGKAERGGTGLGLSISRQLVHSMGGEIAVQSEPGVGSTFTIRLASTTSEPGATAGSDFGGLTGAVADEPGGRLLVLSIEDDPVNTLVLDRMLMHLGQVEVVHEDTGTGGRNAVARSAFDLVLLDMNLPDGHGLAWLPRLRAGSLNPGCRIVASSADALPEAIAGALEAGFDDYLTKPLDMGALQRLLDSLRPGGSMVAAMKPPPGSTLVA